MTTLWQASVRKKRTFRKIKRTHVPLEGCPQKEGVCIDIRKITPRKPCSARRSVARVKLCNKRKSTITCHIPGEGHSLKKYSIVLVRGGRPNDLPAVRYRLIRGARKQEDRYKDLGPVLNRKTSRSKYGVRNIGRLKRTRLQRIRSYN